MPQEKLYLIDANAFCYRAYFALKGLSTSYGQPTNAIFGFVNFLNKIIKQEKPKYLGICFDLSRDTFRQKAFSGYKLKRPEMPQELASQFPIIKVLINAYGITIFEKEGFEADDLIATLAKRARQHNLDVLIISFDKDILQLVDEHIFVFSPYQDKGTLYDSEKIRERFGVGPAQIVDFISLAGDATDNIPGVKGLGPKTALKLLQEFKSIDNLLKNFERIESEKLRLLIKENIEMINLSRHLASLKEDIDLDFELRRLKLKAPDYLQLHKIFRKLEFKRLLKGLPLPADEQEAVSLPNAEAGGISDFTDAAELILFFDKSLTLFAPQKNIVLSPEEEKFDAGLKDLLASQKINKITYDLKALKLKLAKDKLEIKGPCFDVMLAAYVLNPSRSDYSISGLTLDYLGFAQVEGAITSKAACSLISKLKGVLEKELNQAGLFSLFADLEMPLVDVLTDMELTGIKVDLELLKKLSHQIEEQLCGLIEKIFEISGTQFNINSPKQLSQVLFEHLKLPVIKRTKSGASTDEEVLVALAEQHPLPKNLLEYRKLMKIKSTYVDAFPLLIDPKTQRLHTSFNQAGTQTGRLSSSRPNLQNLPVKTETGRQIRRTIISSSEGNLLVSSDYSQIELRVLAHISKDENLISGFKKDKDIHKTTASLIYGLKETDVTDEMRESAKRINFGIIYGLSAFGLSRDLGISLEEAQTFIDAYFLRYPKVKAYIQQQIKYAKENGFVATILGRRRYIPEINNKNQGIRQFAERQAINAPIQGSASDLIKLAMIKIHNQLISKKLKTKMLLQIHDELLFDTPDKELDEFIHLLREGMENIMQLDVPIKVDIKKGRNWLQMEKV